MHKTPIAYRLSAHPNRDMIEPSPDEAEAAKTQSAPLGLPEQALKTRDKIAWQEARQGTIGDIPSWEYLAPRYGRPWTRTSCTSWRLSISQIQG